MEVRPTQSEGIPVLRLQGLCKRYEKNRWILRDIDLEVVSGERLAISGDNGSGKSTLLRITVGLTRPTSGTVQTPEGAIGYVPERFPCHDRMSAASYLRHVGRIRGLSSREAGRRADGLLDRLALAGGSGTPLRQLSKGNVQKVALAQAVLVPPRLLVLDEPASGLAESVHGILADLMREVAANSAAVVFTEHHDAFVRENATRICRISEGRLKSAVPVPEPVPAQDIVRVDISPKAHGSAHPLDWAEMQGVVRTRQSDDSVIIHVTDEHRESILRTALQNGWSVNAVVNETER
jgi:ABC-type multidrug transport system ATPase subunit